MIPLHPIIVHFPVALLISALLFAVLALIVKTKGEKFKEVFKWNLFLGSFASLLAVISGLIEEKTLVHNDAIHEILKVHELLGYITTGIFVVLSLWLIIRNSKLKGTEIKLIILILFSGVVIMAYSAHLGGKMVYEQGAGVVPMEEIINDQTHDHNHNDHSHTTQKSHDNHNH
ncbi:MAG: DUF2231 domain-containing protein [Bacteroidales bacterium]|jgi:uncharacterized membrane protein|nr:DUF2231 domain-containing protein [Bacteroidales bacterium]